MEHIQWIFSGIGVLILGGLFRYLKRKKNESKINIKYQSGNNNIQAEGDVTVNNTTNILKELDKKNPIIEVASKFYFVFDKHGVPRGQLPSFVDEKFNIQYSDVADEESIIPKLNDELLNWVSNKFGIRRSWFDASEDDFYHKRIYDSIDCYRQVWEFIDLFDKLINEFNIYNYRDSISVNFFRNFEDFKGDNTKRNGSILIVVKVVVGKVTTGNVYKYILINNNLRWDYWKSRQDIKRMIRIVEKLNIYNVGYDLSDEEFEQLGSAEIIPRDILNKFRFVTWYPYDFDGSFNDRINEVEYEQDRQFQDSLKDIDKQIPKMLKDKEIEFRKKVMG